MILMSVWVINVLQIYKIIYRKYIKFLLYEWLLFCIFITIAGSTKVQTEYLDVTAITLALCCTVAEQLNGEKEFEVLDKRMRLFDKNASESGTCLWFYDKHM